MSHLYILIYMKGKTDFQWTPESLCYRAVFIHLPNSVMNYYTCFVLYYVHLILPVLLRLGTLTKIFYHPKFVVENGFLDVIAFVLFRFKRIYSIY